LNPRSIGDAESVFDVQPQISCNLYMRYGWSECGFDSVSNPGHQQWVDGPPVFPFLWFFTGLFNRPVYEPEFLSGSQGRSERTCPLFIVVPLQLDLSNRKLRIIKRCNIVWRNRFSILTRYTLAPGHGFCHVFCLIVCLKALIPCIDCFKALIPW